jgi:hypothetical protein
MALQKFDCLRCEKKFEVGDWLCASGESHIVKPETYYVLDAPMDKRDCKNARLQMLNVIPEGKIMRGQDAHVVPGTNIEFVRGLYSTDNPHIQMALNNRHNVFRGEEGRKMWEAVYFSNEEKRELEAMELRGKVQRLENERNTLLEQVKSRAKVPA